MGSNLFSLSLDQFIQAVYLQEKDDDGLFKLYNEVKPTLQSSYDKALLDYYMARAYQSFDSVDVAINHNKSMRKGRFVSLFDFYSARKEAIKFYEMALATIEGQLASYSKKSNLTNSYSDLVALKSDCISQLCLLKSLSYTVGNGLSVARLAKEALSINDKNIRAKMLIASSKIYPPKIYGGDPNGGIELLNQISSDVKNDEDLFNLYSGYGYCYARLENKEKALSYIQKALDIYPTNVFVCALKKMVEEDSF